MVPVLGVPILVGASHLWKMLDSIDYPVGRTIVVDNGGIISDDDASQHRITVIRPRHNLGVAASWNIIIKTNPWADWWMIANHDLVFSNGDIERLAKHMETVGGVALLRGFTVFGIDRGAVRKAGWFDENFVPAYFEDNDYDYRCRLTDVPLNALPSGLQHRNSSTLRDSELYAEANRRTFPKNQKYFLEKWGGSPYKEVYKTPFDQGGDPREWVLDIDRLGQGW